MVVYRVIKVASASKYKEIERSLRQILQEGTWSVGDRLPSEQELSRRFGVSYMTTRQAVAQLVNDGLLQRIVGKGTFVVRQSAERDEAAPISVPLAFVVPALWQRLDPYYFPDVLQGFQDYMAEQGQEALVLDYEAVRSSDKLPKNAAVACILLEDAEKKLVENLKDSGYQVLSVNKYRGRRVIPWVAPDNEGGVYQATERLIKQGHKQIAFIRGNLKNLDAIDRLKGYRKAMRKHGLPTTEAGNGFAEEPGYRAGLELLSSPNPPTALVTASDLSALGAMKAARELGYDIPTRLSVVGFGNFSLISYLNPHLTTVNLPRIELGREAARLLLRMSEGKTVESTTIAAHIVPGQTDVPVGT